MRDSAPSIRRRLAWWFLPPMVLVALIVGYELWWKSPTTRREPPFRTERYHVPQAAVTDLTIKPVSAVGAELADDELVLGVQVLNEARAYPLNMMYAAPHTKVLNDVLAGKPLVVTWCEKCMSGAVFERTLDGQALNFAVFGSLWLDTIVMYDLETWTQWSQWDGQAKVGPRAGQMLERWPCVIADWKSWRQQNPGATVALLDHKRAAFDAAAYSKAEDFLLIAGEGASAKSWSLDDLRRRRVINDTLAGEAVVAVFLESSGTARLFGRQVAGQTLTMVWRDGQLRDAESDSTWNPWTGRAVAGQRRDQTLTAQPGRLIRRTVWKRLSP